MKEELTNIRNSLYTKLPTGEIDSWDLLTIISEHLQKLDKFIDKLPESEKFEMWYLTE